MTGCILLVRHGETEWNRERRYQGWRDSPLTSRGIAQAEAIGRRLAELPEASGAELVASPIGRARHTAEIIRETIGRTEPLTFDNRLREVSIGDWEGLTYAEIEALQPGVFEGAGRHEWYFSAPGSEPYDAFAGRVAEWLAEARQRERSLIVVTHGVVTRVLRGLYVDLPRAEALMLQVPQDRFFRLAQGRIEAVRAGSDQIAPVLRNSAISAAE